MRQLFCINLRSINKKHVLFLAAGLFIFSSCKKAQESELAQQIEFSNTGPEYVLPNELKNVINADDDSLSKYYTCNLSGIVTGPRARIRKISINWKGTGKLLPLVLRWYSTDSQLSSNFSYAYSSAEGGTISKFFGVPVDDFIAENSGLLSNEGTGSPGTAPGSRCYLDIGNLPTLKKPPTGAATVTVRGILALSAIQEDSEGRQTPVIKETELNLIYFPGSIPVK